MFGIGKQKRIPVAGEQWIIRAENGDPWGDKGANPITILEVKEGWVRYKIGDIVFQNERMKASMFVQIYRPLT